MRATILSAERTALNFLGHLSGIATATAAFVERIAHTKARIICTRKTTPGLRALEKYAVRCGGGFNHRFGLDDAVLIKDNHIAVAGGIRAVLTRAKAAIGHLVKIEIEVDSLDQLEEVLDVGLADVVLIDNFDLAAMRKAVAIGGRPSGHRSLRRHHAGQRRGDRRNRRRLSELRRTHPFGAESRHRSRHRDVNAALALRVLGIGRGRSQILFGRFFRRAGFRRVMVGFAARRCALRNDGCDCESKRDRDSYSYCQRHHANLRLARPQSINRSCGVMIGAQSFAVDSLLAGVAAACGPFAVASGVSALLVFGTGP